MPRVLVVADDLPTLRALKKLLEYDGHAVVCASSGATAVEALRREGLDVVVADLDMPAPSGEEVARRARELRPEACLYIFSASADAPTVNAIDPCFVLMKPLDYDALQAQLLAFRDCTGHRHERRCQAHRRR